MLAGIYDEEKKTLLYTADLSFSADTLSVESCTGMSPQDCEAFLLSRCRCPQGYGAEKALAARFRLSGREHEFGRLQEAKVLYALLDHFRVPEDTLAVFPAKNEVVSVIGTDCRFSNLYTWRKFQG
jgi:hypothetical protein